MKKITSRKNADWYMQQPHVKYIFPPMNRKPNKWWEGLKPIKKAKKFEVIEVKPKATKRRKK